MKGKVKKRVVFSKKPLVTYWKKGEISLKIMNLNLPYHDTFGSGRR